MAPKTKFYAVQIGSKPGIYNTWEECEKQVKGFFGAKYKSFQTRKEAEYFIDASVKISDKISFINSSNDFNTDSFLNESALNNFNTDLSKDKLVIYTDGSFRNNKAGYGIVMLSKDFQKEFSGAIKVDKLTNNVAELTAVLEAFNNFPKDIIKDIKDIKFMCDSEYVVKIFNERLEKWIKQNRLDDMANPELIKDILKEMEKYFDKNITFTHIYSHCNDYWNERADYLANQHTEK